MSRGAKTTLPVPKADQSKDNGKSSAKKPKEWRDWEAEQKLYVKDGLTLQLTQLLIEEGNKEIDAKKGKQGRPTRYTPEIHIPATLHAMSQGASYQELCLELGVLPCLIWHWRERHPSFSVTIKMGEALSEAWWRRKGRLNIHNKEFNHGLWLMNMANRFGWANKVEGKIESKHTESRIDRREMQIDVNIGNLSTTQLEILNAIFSDQEGKDQKAPKAITA